MRTPDSPSGWRAGTAQSRLTGGARCSVGQAEARPSPALGAAYVTLGACIFYAGVRQTSGVQCTSSTVGHAVWPHVPQDVRGQSTHHRPAERMVQPPSSGFHSSASFWRTMAASCILLHTGQKMPLIGLGTWKSDPGQVKAAIKYALSVGYRHIDCAAIYGNETEIGEALKENVGPGKLVPREELFVTSKLWNTKHHPEDVEPALRKTLADLQLEYLDLYLMHWPYAFERGDSPFPKNADGTIRYDSTHYKETWRALEALVAKGLVRALGLSNFNSRQIDDVLSVASVRPAVLQVECHPYLAQNELIAHCQARGLEVTAYSPLGSSDRAWRDPEEPVLLKEPVVLALAEKHGRSPAQILLRWQVQRKVSCIPKSVTPSRILENIQVFDFTFSPEEMKQLDALNKNLRFIVPMLTVDGKRVPRDAGHPLYPFNDPY